MPEAPDRLPEIPESELPELEEGQYPPAVETEEQRRRFRICWAIADKIFEGDESAAWYATRSLYQGDLKT